MRGIGCRSQSQQEPPPAIIEKSVSSPVMLRRKDSFKAHQKSDDVLKDDNNRLNFWGHLGVF